MQETILLNISFLLFFPINDYAQEPSQSITEQTIKKNPINLILYESRTKKSYAYVTYMPYYPAYGMIHYNTAHCKIEMTGFIDPFELKKNKLIISYKKCKVSFDQKGKILANPSETESCQNLHSDKCNFTAIPDLTETHLHF